MIGLEFLLILAIFIAFLIVIRRAAKILLNTILIVLASAAFPIIMNFLGFPVELTLGNILFFVLLGVALYLIYLFGKFIYSALGIAEKFVKSIPPKAKKKKKEIENEVKKSL